MTTTEKAFEAYKNNRKLATKYQVADNMWMDWYAMGYRQAQKDYKQKAIEAYKDACCFSSVGRCQIKEEAGRCNCNELKDFIEEYEKL